MGKKDNIHARAVGGSLSGTLLPYLLVALLICIMAIFFLVRGKRSTPRRTGLHIDGEAMVESIRSISELSTVTYYEELVLKGKKISDFGRTPLGVVAREGLGKETSDELVLIAKGTIRAGVDLSRMKKEDVSYRGDTVVVSLPDPEYLDIIINPSDYEVFFESGTWTATQIAQVQADARERLIKGADYFGVKREAYQNACQSVETLLRGLGAKHVAFDVPLQYRTLPLPPED